MPGIVGIITKMPRERVERQLEKMVQTLHHEDFYSTGTWTDETAGVYIGWITRDQSFPGGRPLESEQGDKVLFLSGEEFSGEGTPFYERKGDEKSNRRGSYLVEMAEKDSTFPACLNGRFQGLLVDRRAGSAQLFNDRFGLHRLYYYDAGDAVYFAAEAKAILAVRPECRGIDPRGFGELISNGCVLENRSIFKGISVLPPASSWHFCRGTLQKKGFYFKPKEWEDQEPLDMEAYYGQLRDVFARNMPKYFGGDQPVGVSLTGGLDSRMIMAWMKAPAGSVPCFSFGGPYRDCRDVTIARKVARTCGQEHHTIRVADDYLARFQYYAERTVFLTDGCVNIEHSPDLYVNEIARKIAPVRMTGNYGGEVLRSIRAFKPEPPAPGLFKDDINVYLDQAQQTYSGLINVRPLSFSVFRQAPWHHYGLLSLEETQLALRSPYLDNDFVRTVFRAPKSVLTSNEVSFRLIQDGNPALSRIPTDRGLIANGGLWNRLGNQYQEFTVKAEYAYDYGMPQFVARVDHAFSALHFERLFLGRHKFYHFRIWLRDALSKDVKEILLDPRTLRRPYLNPGAVEKMVECHIAGTRNHTNEILKLMTLEFTHRLFLDE